MGRTYYDVLGVERAASTAEIEAAYRARLKETHPDVTDDPDATDTVQEVIDARDVLTDEAERARYDRIGHDAYVSGELTGRGSKPSDTATSRTWSERPSSDHRRSSRDSASVGPDSRDRTGSQSSGHTTRNGAGRGSPDFAGTGHHAKRSAGGEGAWAGTGGNRVPQPPDPNAVRRSRLFPPGESAVLLLAAFICYPPFLLFSVYPPFPIAFNIVVGGCTLVLVGYLISLPAVGILVFGLWGIVTLGAIVTGTLGVATIPGVLALTATWLPLFLSIVVYRLVR